MHALLLFISLILPQVNMEDDAGDDVVRTPSHYLCPLSQARINLLSGEVTTQGS